jgi:hypothetical protein
VTARIVLLYAGPPALPFVALSVRTLRMRSRLSHPDRRRGQRADAGPARRRQSAA